LQEPAQKRNTLPHGQWTLRLIPRPISNLPGILALLADGFVAAARVIVAAADSLVVTESVRVVTGNVPLAPGGNPLALESVRVVTGHLPVEPESMPLGPESLLLEPASFPVVTESLPVAPGSLRVAAERRGSGGVRVAAHEAAERVVAGGCRFLRHRITLINTEVYPQEFCQITNGIIYLRAGPDEYGVS
jgi:hypothetical protein